MFKELDYSVRYEKGTFNSGYCIVENNKVVVVNKFFDTDGRVSILLDILETLLSEESMLSEKSSVFYKALLKKELSNV